MLQMALDFYSEIPEELQWDEHDVEILRDGILRDAIQQVFDSRNSLRERVDILAWMLDTEEHPFSFKVCCLSVGVDPDELVGRIEDSLKKMAPTGKPCWWTS